MRVGAVQAAIRQQLNTLEWQQQGACSIILSASRQAEQAMGPAAAHAAQQQLQAELHLLSASPPAQLHLDGLAALEGSKNLPGLVWVGELSMLNGKVLRGVVPPDDQRHLCLVCHIIVCYRLCHAAIVTVLVVPARQEQQSGGRQLRKVAAAARRQQQLQQ